MRQSALPSWTLLTTACVTRCLWGTRGSSRSVVEVEVVVVEVVVEVVEEEDVVEEVELVVEEVVVEK